MNGKSSKRPLRLLCISPAFIPYADSETYCGGKMVLALMEQGVEVKVISDPRYLALPGARRADSALWAPLENVVEGTSYRPGRWSLRALYSCVRYMAYSRWADVAVQCARRMHSERPFDVVYSRSLPIQAHVVGYWCARLLDLPWVANSNDPWDPRVSPVAVDEVLSPIRLAHAAYWLKTTVRNADVMTFPSERLAQKTLKVARARRRVQIIPHVGLSVSVDPPDDGFHLVHAGKLGMTEIAAGRSARGLLDGLHSFLRTHPDARGETKLTLIGPRADDTDARIRELRLESVVKSTDRVSYEESLRWIARATVCVLVERAMPEGIFLPSKVADYVVAGKPVLALSPPVGTVADISGEAGILRVNADDAQGVADALTVLYDDYKRGMLDRHRPSEALVRKFRPADVARQFLSALEAAGIRPR